MIGVGEDAGAAGTSDGDPIAQQASTPPPSDLGGTSLLHGSTNSLGRLNLDAAVGSGDLGFTPSSPVMGHSPPPSDVDMMPLLLSQADDAIAPHDDRRVDAHDSVLGGGGSIQNVSAQSLGPGRTAGVDEEALPDATDTTASAALAEAEEEEPPAPTVPPEERVTVLMRVVAVFDFESDEDGDLNFQVRHALLSRAVAFRNCLMQCEPTTRCHAVLWSSIIAPLIS